MKINLGAKNTSFKTGIVSLNSKAMSNPEMENSDDEEHESKSQTQAQTIVRDYSKLRIVDEPSLSVLDIFDNLISNPSFRIQQECQNTRSHHQHSKVEEIKHHDESNRGLPKKSNLIENNTLDILLMELLNEITTGNSNADDDCKSVQSLDSLEYYNRKGVLSPPLQRQCHN